MVSGGRGRTYYTVKTLRTTRKPLFQRNPFRSIGVKQRSTNIFVGPLKREGITSIEMKNVHVKENV